MLKITETLGLWTCQQMIYSSCEFRNKNVGRNYVRITFTSPAVGMGGGTRVLSIYARELVRMGHTVLFVSPPHPTEPLIKRVRSWCKWHAGHGNAPPVTSHLDGSGIDHKVLDRWRPILDGDLPDADVVIATWWETAEWVNALSPQKGAKVFFIQHHEVFPYLPIARCRATYRLPLHKVVVAEWLKHVMSSEYGDDVVDVVPNSVDHVQFHAPVRGKQTVPTVGLLHSAVPFKGLIEALGALRIARERFPKSTCNFIW